MNDQLKDIHPIERKSAEMAFCSGDSKRICDALIRVTYYDNDYEWVLNKCIDFTQSESFDVRRLAIICFGHLARIYGTLDKKKVIALLEVLKKDPRLEGVVEDALDDIDMFT